MAAFVRLSDATAVPPETRVLKARDFLAYMQAEEMLATAQRRAAEIADEAKKKYAAEKARGYADGQDEAKIEFMEQIMETVGQTVEYFAQVEKQVADVVMASLRKIIGEMDDDEVVLRAVKNALAVVRDQQEITVRVCADQAEGIQAKINDILRGANSASYLHVVADHRLLPGSCRLETDMGVVDVSIGLQLDALEKALMSRVGQGKD